jgi:demethylmenaquinone methyltransferase/2-methoxy-6-polyprenyl-1,4-benzoquinol methylase
VDQPPVRHDPVIDAYRRQAKRYDASGVGGLDEWRREAVRLLALAPGSLVIDVGCGTGLNFALLQEAVGPQGQIVGVDLTDAMLDQARQRVAAHGWQNVELVQADAAQYRFPAQVDGIISTLALTFVPDGGAVIRHGADALAPGRKWVVLDMAWPAYLPMWMRHILVPLRRYGITPEVIKRRPWKTVQQAMDEHLTAVEHRRFWLGFFYLSSGRRAE